MYDMNQRRAANEVLLYKQFQFLNTRMEAYETVLTSRSTMLKAILNPKWLAREVNLRQALLMKAHDDAMREVAKKQKEEAAKPKLTIVGANGIKAMVAIIAFALFSGCVSNKYHAAKVAEAYKVGYDQADKECLDLQNRIAGYVNSLKDRLKKYGQLDEKGNLKPLKKWTGDESGWDGPDGTEEWMK